MTATTELMELKGRAQKADAALERARVQYEQSEVAVKKARETLIEVGLDPDGNLEAQLGDLRGGIDELLSEIEKGLADA